VGTTARARTTNSRTASDWARRSTGRAAPRSGTASGGTSHTVSPAIAKGSRLVAKIRRWGQAQRSRSASSAHGPTRCSQVSSTRRIAWERNASDSVTSSGRSGCSGSFRSEATACVARAGSLIAASSTSHAPSGNWPSAPDATSSASRVLPTPPVPTSVSSLVEARRCRTAATSRSRPTKLASWNGRLFGGVAIALCPHFRADPDHYRRPSSRTRGDALAVWRGLRGAVSDGGQTDVETMCRALGTSRTPRCRCPDRRGTTKSDQRERQKAMKMTVGTERAFLDVTYCGGLLRRPRDALQNFHRRLVFTREKPPR
jgi:hypothetical protein